MLVLTRKQAEQIRIGDNIMLTVLRIDGNKVRIGIEAPEEVQIKRSELDSAQTDAQSFAANSRNLVLGKTV